MSGKATGAMSLRFVPASQSINKCYNDIGERILIMQPALDMRSYIKRLEEMGEIHHFTGVDLYLEVGALNELVGEQEGQALFFDEFKGYPKGYRVICNLFRTCRRTAIVMGLP